MSMANEQMRAALEAAREEFRRIDHLTSKQLFDYCPDSIIKQIDEALKSAPTSAVTVLDQRLAVLPENMERNAHTVLDLQVEKCKQERELDLLRAEATYEVFTNPDYKDDAVRQAKLVMVLLTNEVYHEKLKALDKTKILLQRARIAYQRSRDMFDAYRSIAAMGAK